MEEQDTIPRQTLKLKVWASVSYSSGRREVFEYYLTRMAGAMDSAAYGLGPDEEVDPYDIDQYWDCMEVEELVINLW